MKNRSQILRETERISVAILDVFIAHALVYGSFNDGACRDGMEVVVHGMLRGGVGCGVGVPLFKGMGIG